MGKTRIFVTAINNRHFMDFKTKQVTDYVGEIDFIYLHDTKQIKGTINPIVIGLVLLYPTCFIMLARFANSFIALS